MTSTADIKVASLAAGFTLGFGVLTVWEAIKQTRLNRNPLRSTYIYMLWGEIVANLIIGIIGWFFLDGQIGPTIPVLLTILVSWVFEVQLLLQIIVNRIAIIAEDPRTILMLKWGTALVITCIEIAVFCIWIPAHMNPPVSHVYVRINFYWDRISKVLILIVDALLNWYFLRTVKIRLVQHHNLKKYDPLVGFNAKLMVVSIAMDIMLIGLMSFPNQVVYIQFHPVAYMVKLNIEMSMARLITRLARRQETDMTESLHPTNEQGGQESYVNNSQWTRGNAVELTKRSHAAQRNSDVESAHSEGGFSEDMAIRKKTEIVVEIEQGSPGMSQGSGDMCQSQHTEDEMPLTSNAGHPRAYAYSGNEVPMAITRD